jgi:hypothetical protein
MLAGATLPFVTVRSTFGVLRGDDSHKDSPDAQGRIAIAAESWKQLSQL